MGAGREAVRRVGKEAGMSLQRVGVIFGGRSVEHEVSVLTAHQAMAALRPERYTALPIYITKAGQWLTGPALRTLDHFRDLERLPALAESVVFSPDATRPGVLHQPVTERRRWFGGGDAAPRLEPLDVVFPLVHGTHGEDGTLQGLCELADLPYVGSGVAASAIAMDKVLTKVVLRGASLPVLDDLPLTRARWEAAPDAVVAEAEARFGYPVFVKPVSLGSSIAVARADDGMALRQALAVAATYDRQIMIEPAAQGVIEVNCAVLGDGADNRASVCEQPVSAGLLSYEDKYLHGDKQQGMKGARRIIPAPLPPALTEAIQSAARRAFAAIGAAGVARVDLLVRPEEGVFFINEINPIPGSLAFYLWEPAGLDFPTLLDQLIELAQARHQEKRRSTFSFASSLLDGHALAGASARKV
jgi:D-alanine-D-alanine ligase